MKHAVLFLGLSGLAASAQAATYQANAGNLAQVIAMAQAGDTITLQGVFGETSLKNLSYASALVLDARKASFTGGLSLKDVTGVTIKGGTFGSPLAVPRLGRWIDVNGGSMVRIDGATVVGADGEGIGLLARDITAFTVTRASFSGLKLGLGVQTIQNGLLSNNQFTANSWDGINVVDSRSVTVSGNVCSGSLPPPGGHPDCVQLWSIAGNPMQSNIKLIANKAYGATQGFTSFDPDTGSGSNLLFDGNYVESIFPQGIACYGCFNSIFRNNILVAMPEARWRTSLNVVGGSGNTVTGTVLVDNRTIGLEGGLPPADAGMTGDLLTTYGQRDSLADALAGPDALVVDGKLLTRLLPDTGGLAAGTAGARFSMASAAFASVPEPASWLQWLSGFALLGLWQRRRVPGLA